LRSVERQRVHAPFDEVQIAIYNDDRATLPSPLPAPYKYCCSIHPRMTGTWWFDDRRASNRVPLGGAFVISYFGADPPSLDALVSQRKGLIP
jgi:hypothetical protein